MNIWKRELHYGRIQGLFKNFSMLFGIFGTLKLSLLTCFFKNGSYYIINTSNIPTVVKYVGNCTLSSKQNI